MDNLEKLKNILFSELHANTKISSIKKDADLFDFVSSIEGGSSLSEKVHLAIGASPVCEYGNVKKFKTISNGYGFCDIPTKCKCSREKSKNSSKSFWNNASDDAKANILEKTKSTNLEKYGVEYACATESAKESREEFYNDKDKVSASVIKGKRTKKARYGNENFNNIEKHKISCMEKYGTEFYNQTEERKKEISSTHYTKDPIRKEQQDEMRKEMSILRNENRILMYDDDKILEISKHKTPHQMAEMMGYSNSSCVIQRLRKITDNYKKSRSSSSDELELYNFICSIVGEDNVMRNDRTLIGKELDIVVPSYKIAIEFNGCYWHSDVHKDKNYHLDKTNLCKSNGYSLIHVGEDLWNLKKDIIKNKIKHLLGKTNERVYARKCKIRQVTSSDARQFIDKNHIQGYSNASFKYGLYHGDVLVSIMTFGKPRMGIGNTDCEYELVRYASSVSVVGGASKLFKRFIKDVNPKSILSYSLNDWNSGSLYDILGFEYSHDTPPNFWYIECNTLVRHHRYKFAKYKLLEQGYDQTKTGFEIMNELPYHRVYDTGSKVFTWRMEC